MHEWQSDSVARMAAHRGGRGPFKEVALYPRLQELRFQLQAFLLHPQPAAPEAMRALLEDQRLRDFFSREAEFLETRRSSLKYPFLNVPPPNHSIAPFAPHAAANRDLADAHGPPDLDPEMAAYFRAKGLHFWRSEGEETYSSSGMVATRLVRDFVEYGAQASIAWPIVQGFYPILPWGQYDMFARCGTISVVRWRL